MKILLHMCAIWNLEKREGKSEFHISPYLGLANYLMVLQVPLLDTHIRTTIMIAYALASCQFWNDHWLEH